MGKPSQSWRRWNPSSRAVRPMPPSYPQRPGTGQPGGGRKGALWPGLGGDLPGRGGVEQGPEVTGSLAVLGPGQLLVHQRAVIGPLHRPEDADGGGRVGALGQPGEHEGQAGVLPALVVDEQGLLPHVGHVDDAGPALAVQHHALLPLDAEADGLAVHEGDQVAGPGLLGRYLLEGAVVEHVAVLVDLDQSRSAVVMGPPERLHHVLAVHVMGPGHEAGIGPERQAHGVEGGVEGPEGGGLGDLAHLGGGRVLALGEAVDLVVEQQDREVHVPPQGVDEVVAPYRQGIPVTADDPHVEVGAGQGQAGGDGRGTPVDGVHPVGPHVVGEAGGTPDAGDEDRALPPDVELGQQHLHGGEDRVVPATRAPADLLVRGPVLAGGGGGKGIAHRFPLWSRRPSRKAANAASTSPARKGTPWTLVMGWASTENSARTSFTSWPRLFSGTTTWR